MSKPKIILLGAGGHSHACIDVIELEGNYEIAGLIGQPNEIGNRLFGYDVIAMDENLPELNQDYKYAAIAVGQIKSPNLRIKMYNQLKLAGFSLPVIISPRAYVSRSVAIGESTIIMHDALINNGASIGVNCIINTKSLVEHDVKVGDHCHISTGAIINGGTIIKDKVFIGSNALIKNNLIVGEDMIVGAGDKIFNSIYKA